MKLEINYAKKTKRLVNTWKLNNMCLKNQWIKEKTKTEIKHYMQTNKNKNTTAQNLWEAAKAVLRGKCIATQAYLKKQDQSPKYSLK